MIDLLIIFFATYLIYIFIPVAVWILHHRDKITLLRVFTSVIIATVTSYLVKTLFYLPRPFISSGHLPLVNFVLDGSLPSGHTAFSFAFSFAVMSRHRKVGLFLVCVSTLIALGRIASGVHSPLDVSVGLIVALVSFLIGQRLFRD